MQPNSNHLNYKILYIGIDVSRKELVIAYKINGKWKKVILSNKLTAINQWLEEFGTHDKVFVLEHTGTYSDRLIHCLDAHSAKMIVANPIQSSAMAKCMGNINKTDWEDAKTLCALGERGELPLYKMPKKTHKQLKQVFSAIVNYEKQEQRIVNQLHALEYSVGADTMVLKLLKADLHRIKMNIEQLTEHASKLIDSCEATQTVKNLCTIKGVGQKTAGAIVSLFGDLSTFKSAKAFAKFIGLCPTTYESGTSVYKKSRITKRGNGKIRSLLFNCARSAIVHNENIKAFYNNLKSKGKNGKAALTAVMHKLARIIFAVATIGIPYDLKFATKINFNQKHA